MLTIYKHGRLNFQHVAPGLNYDLFPSRFYVDILNDFFQIKETGGSLHYKIDWQKIVIVDLTTSTTYNNIASKQELWNILIALEYQGIVDEQAVINNTANRVWIAGQRIAIVRTQSWIDANFDVNGMGINEMEGWKKATQNAGRVSVCQHSILYPTIGTPGGNATITLTRSQLPNETIGYTGDNGTGFPDGSDDSIVAGHPRSYPRQSRLIRLGDGAAVDIRQPYIVELHIERVTDMILVGQQYVLPFNQNQIDAILNSSGPSAANPFATIADITGSVTDTPLFLLPVRIRKGISNTNPATKALNEAGDYFEYGLTDSGSGESFLVVGRLNVTEPTDITDLSNFTHLTTVGA